MFEECMRNSSFGNSITHEFPVLVALQGPLEGRRWIIREAIDIGRDEDCAIRIEERQVSRHHARLRNENGICYIEDLGSKNGTFLSGAPLIESTRLGDGDTFQIALIQKFAFFSSDATMPIEDLDPTFLKGSGKLVLEERSRRVWIGREELLPPLSAAQFRLFATLYNQAGEVVTREALIRKTWEEDEATGVSDQALDALIRRLRERLAELDQKHQYIVTVRGHGVRLENF
jgi:hypothetical protein